MEDNLDLKNERQPQFKTMEFLKFFENGRQPHFFLNRRRPQYYENGRQPQFFRKWKPTSFF
jgi:hypothetical protein